MTIHLGSYDNKNANVYDESSDVGSVHPNFNMNLLEELFVSKGGCSNSTVSICEVFITLYASNSFDN